MKYRPRKNKTKYNGQILFSKPHYLDKTINRRPYTMPNKQSVCKYENQKQTRTISNNKNTLQRNDNDRHKMTNQPVI